MTPTIDQTVERLMRLADDYAREFFFASDDHIPSLEKELEAELRKALAPMDAQPVATVIKHGPNREWMSERLGELPDGTYKLYTSPQDVAPQIAQAVAVPAGFAMVPIEPTQEMCQAGQRKANEWRAFPLRISPIYQAMLSAAPKGQPEVVGGVTDTQRMDWVDKNLFYRDMDDSDKKMRPDSWMWVIFAPKGTQGDARRIIDAAIAATTPIKGS